MKRIYGIDMTSSQYNKLITEIPTPDVVIFMGCNVSCPHLPHQYSENWGLDDPTGQSDEFFEKTIASIECKVRELADKLK